MRQRILAVDDQLCTETFLRNLIANTPDKEDDLEVMKRYIEAPEEECQALDTPEQFIVEV